MVPRIFRNKSIFLQWFTLCVVGSFSLTSLVGQTNSDFAPLVDPPQNVPANHLFPEIDFGDNAPNHNADEAPSVDLNAFPTRPENRGQSLIVPPQANSPSQSILQSTQATLPAGSQSSRNLLTGEIYASFDFMFLERSGPSPQAFVFTNGVPTLNTTSMTYDAEFSPAATIAIGDQYGYALEFSFLSSANHRFSGTQAGTNVVPVFFGGIPATPVNSYTIRAQSQMDNYELNQWVSHTERLRLGLGLRIIDMSEEFDITESGTSSGFFSITDNELFGAQFLAQYIFLANDYATVYFQGKSGLYYNRVKVAATAENISMAPDSDEISFVGDLRLVADMPLTNHVSFRAGYQATFLTRVAQALDQNDDLFIGAPGNPGLFDFSTPTYRGGFFGIVVGY